MRSDKRKNKNRFRKNKETETSVVNADGTAAKKRYRLNKKQFFKFLLALVLVMIIGVAVYVGVVIAQAPEIKTDEIYDILTESTIIYDDDGNEIDTVYTAVSYTHLDVYKRQDRSLIDVLTH